MSQNRAALHKRPAQGRAISNPADICGAPDQTFEKQPNLSARLSTAKQRPDALLQRRQLLNPRQRRARLIRNSHLTPRRESKSQRRRMISQATTVVLGHSAPQNQIIALFMYQDRKSTRLNS